MARQKADVLARTDDLDQGGWEGFLDMTDEAPGAHAIHVPENFREFSDSLEYEAFMNERVGIQIAEASNERESPVVPVGVNGHQRWLPRNVPLVVRRTHLERLVRASTTTFSVEKLHDPELDEGQRIKNKNLPAYHIQILKDDNPMGMKWLNRMRREGC